jgi:hypothetical protein
MTALSFSDFDAPEGWTNLTATAPYTALLGQNVQVICKTGQGAIFWGGATAPTHDCWIRFTDIYGEVAA